LRELGAESKPVITALNKMDLLADERDSGAGEDDQQVSEGEGGGLLERVGEMMREYPNCVAISAADGLGLEGLLTRVQELLEEDLVPVVVLLPYSSDGLVGLIHQRGTIDREEYRESGVLLEARVPEGMAQLFERYLVE
jgi:GTP-binding protein HflX